VTITFGSISLLHTRRPAEKMDASCLRDRAPDLTRRSVLLARLSPRTIASMNITFSTRTDAARLVLATALVMMCVSALGTSTGLASWPVMQIIQDRVNSLVTPAVALVNALTIGLVLLGLRAARSRAVASPTSVWGQNAALLDVATFVTLVYLAEVVVSFLGQEARSFVEIPIGNATQIDMFSPVARFCFEALFPAAGAVILLVVGPRFLRNDSERSSVQGGRAVR
jgi:hypothetical protein